MKPVPRDALIGYARRQNALPFIHYAVAAVDNVEKRAQEIRSLIDHASVRHAEMEDEAQNLDSSIYGLSRKAKDLHYVILSVVEKLEILAETFFTSVEVVRKNYRKLPYAVLQKTSPWEQVRWVKRAALGEVRSLFLFPKPSAIFKDARHRRILRKVSASAILRIAQSLRQLALFLKRYRQIINKYKHTVSEHTGYVERVESGGEKTIRTAIFFEDYPPPRRDPAKRGARRRRRPYRPPRPVTWVLLVEPEIFSYFHQILRDLVALHKLLLMTRLDHLHNQGGPFIPVVADFLNDAELKALKGALNEEQKFRSIGKIDLSTNVRWSSKVRALAQKQAIKKNWVFRLSKHVFRGRKAVSSARIQT
jgi:hypothetical protein